MSNKIVFLDIKKLRGHEETNKERLLTLIEEIKQDGCIKNPVVVEDKHFVILDGHHRIAVLKQLRANWAPVFLVSYFDKNIRVYLRRKELAIENIKEAVLKMGKSNKLFPHKTTKHLISNRPKNLNVPLDKLF